MNQVFGLIKKKSSVYQFSIYANLFGDFWGYLDGNSGSITPDPTNIFGRRVLGVYEADVWDPSLSTNRLRIETPIGEEFDEYDWTYIRVKNASLNMDNTYPKNIFSFIAGTGYVEYFCPSDSNVGGAPPFFSNQGVIGNFEIEVGF